MFAPTTAISASRAEAELIRSPSSPAAVSIENLSSSSAKLYHTLPPQGLAEYSGVDTGWSPTMRKSIARLCLGLVVLLLSGPVRAGGLQDAETLLEENRTTAAMTLLRSHIEENPEDVAAHELLIDILINAKLFQEAEEIYRSRKDADTSSADAWYLLGRTLMNPESAQSAYEQAIQLSPGHPRATMGRAAIFRATGRYPEAMEEYRAALRQDPTLAEAWIGLWASQGMADDMVGALQTPARPQRRSQKPSSPGW